MCLNLFHHYLEQTFNTAIDKYAYYFPWEKQTDLLRGCSYLFCDLYRHMLKNSSAQHSRPDMTFVKWIFKVQFGEESTDDVRHNLFSAKSS